MVGVLVIVMLWAEAGQPAPQQTVAPKNTGADKFLLFSQVFLVGSGTGAVVSHASRNPQVPAGNSVASVSLIGSAVAMERMLEKPSWSANKKVWVGVANITTGIILTGFLRKQVIETRDAVRSVPPQ